MSLLGADRVTCQGLGFRIGLRFDERGEDYGYAADRFFTIDVPKPLGRVLLKAAL
jgi:hypothetical protein